MTEGEHDFLPTESISGHAHDFLSSTSISNDRVALFQGKVANSEGGFGEFGQSGFQDFMSRSIVGDILQSSVDTDGAVSEQPRKQPAFIDSVAKQAAEHDVVDGRWSLEIKTRHCGPSNNALIFENLIRNVKW